LSTVRASRHAVMHASAGMWNYIADTAVMNMLNRGYRRSGHSIGAVYFRNRLWHSL
jgi:hypothetical protein